MWEGLLRPRTHGVGPHVPWITKFLFPMKDA